MLGAYSSRTLLLTTGENEGAVLFDQTKRELSGVNAECSSYQSYLKQNEYMLRVDEQRNIEVNAVSS